MDVILIFAGGESPAGPLSAELPRADYVIAADSGYDLAIAEGYVVDLLIGDFDSIQSEVIGKHVVVESHPVDKDATDLELSMERALPHDPRQVVVVGGSGGRIDHELAVAMLLCSERWSDVPEIDWLTTRGWAHVIRGRRVLHADPGSTITLLPIAGPAEEVTTRGLRWNLSGETLTPGTTRGVSNVVDGPLADIEVGVGCLLAVLPVP